MLQLFPEANLSKPSPEIVDTFPLINSPLAELKVIAWESSSVCALPNVTLTFPVTGYLPLIGHTLLGNVVEFKRDEFRTDRRLEFDFFRADDTQRYRGRGNGGAFQHAFSLVNRLSATT